jgi:hypothetical protein
LQAPHVGTRHQLGELQSAVNEGNGSEILATIVQEIEGKDREIVLSVGESCFAALSTAIFATKSATN